ncbi:hypothetical protein BVC80_8827g11 [Macleaya cordata]|uniref:Uncharacterized protein n=1 Tax=Macleaya cordata TaxID=56857 RepID=A0A200PS66_MACCD|nr:hypothetical protein BVC80_8827g11 [Macleaya cordata]
MTMLESIQKRSFLPTKPMKESLPVSQTNSNPQGNLRRRLSSLSLGIPPSISSQATSWAFHRSKSMSSFGESAGTSVRKWWDWGWAWILSRKPIFAKDLEMNEEESAMLGFHNKGTLSHVFYKVRFELRKLMNSNAVGATQGFKYDSYSYTQNFDNGVKNKKYEG